MDFIQQIAERVVGLRDALDLSMEEVAQQCGIPVHQLAEYESGNVDIPVSFLHELSAAYGVELTTLMFGNEPTMRSYYITRSGQGIKVERTGAYSYQDLAAGFQHRAMAPFMVTVEPHNDGREQVLNTHEGQEFNYVVEGTLEITVAGKVNILHAGDSIMFDSKKPHGLRALDGKRVKMLAIIS